MLGLHVPPVILQSAFSTNAASPCGDLGDPLTLLRTMPRGAPGPSGGDGAPQTPASEVMQMALGTFRGDVDVAPEWLVLPFVRTVLDGLAAAAAGASRGQREPREPTLGFSKGDSVIARAILKAKAADWPVQRLVVIHNLFRQKIREGNVAANRWTSEHPGASEQCLRIVMFVKQEIRFVAQTVGEQLDVKVHWTEEEQPRAYIRGDAEMQTMLAAADTGEVCEVQFQRFVNSVMANLVPTFKEILRVQVWKTSDADDVHPLVVLDVHAKTPDGEFDCSVPPYSDTESNRNTVWINRRRSEEASRLWEIMVATNGIFKTLGHQRFSTIFLNDPSGAGAGGATHVSDPNFVRSVRPRRNLP